VKRSLELWLWDREIPPLHQSILPFARRAISFVGVDGDHQR
jgi:hypothetical protein